MPSLDTHGLELECELTEVRLNDPGKYYLRLSLLNSQKRPLIRKITAQHVGSGKKADTKPTIVTDMVLLTKKNKDSGVKFKNTKFLFTIPRGLCEENARQALTLSIGVFIIVPPDPKGQKQSAGLIDIFPRNKPPIPNLDDPDELYVHEGSMTFTKTSSATGNIKQIGKVKFEVALRWGPEDAPPPPEKPLEKPKESPKKEEPKPMEPEDKPAEKEEEKKGELENKEEDNPKDKEEDEKPEKEDKPESPKEEVEREKVKESTPEPESKSPEKEKTPSLPPSPDPIPIPEPTPVPKEPTPPPKAPTPPPKEATPPPPTPPHEPTPPPKQPTPPLTPPLPEEPPKDPSPEQILASFQAHGIIETKPATPPTPEPPPPPPPPPVMERELTQVQFTHFPIDYRYRRRDIESPRVLNRHYKMVNFRDNTVARAGHIEVGIIVHAASQLPKLPDGSIAKPYVIGRGKGRYTARNHIEQRVTHPSVRPSLAPSWEELIVVEIKTKDVKKESVHLLIADSYTRKVMLEYQLDLAFLRPFHQYHLDLVQSIEPDDQGVVQASHLFVSVMLKPSQLPMIGALEFQAFEVMLIAMEESLGNPIGPLTAVARVVPDYFNYVQCISQQQDASALTSLSLQCPSPHPSSFMATQTKFGHPQWSLPGLPEQHPIWNHTYLFCNQNELGYLFTDTAALVIEFYPTSLTFNGNTWSLPQCCGYCSLLLDNRLLEALLSERGSMGIRVDHIVMQLTNLKNRYNEPPSVGVVLRLPTTSEPDTRVSVSDVDALPTLEAFLRPDIPTHDSPLFTKIDLSSIITPPSTQQTQQTQQTQAVMPFKLKSKRPTNDEDPSHNALENIFKLAKQSSPGNSSHGSAGSGLIPTRLPPKGIQNGHHSSSPPSSSTSSDRYAFSLLDSQQKEIESYKEALKRMGEDIVRLQEELAKLEMDNSHLRKRISMHEDATKAIINVRELDDLSRADLIDKYVTLTRKLSSQIDETTEYREKLVRIQNNMIKQNDREQQYLKHRDNLLKQQDELQYKGEKIKKLERTCVEQERALEKMERILRNKLKNNKAEESNRADELNALAAENVRLRAQIEQIRKTPPRRSSSDDAEKLRLQLQLEKAKGRVSGLERELMEKAREWGKEKEVMRLRVVDQRNNHRSLPPLPRERGYNNYSMSDDDADDYPSPKYTRHKRLSPLSY